MAIYYPEVHLSQDDKELLHLLAHLILSSSDEGIGSNYPPHQVTLSDAEALRLLQLLQQFLTSKKFIEGSYLIEEVFNRSPLLYEGTLRNIYLSWKRRHGRSRALATAQWDRLLARLGVQDIRTDSPWYRPPVQQMPFSHFLKMEEKLASSANLHPKVLMLISSFIRYQETYVDQIRSGKQRLKSNQISFLPRKLINEISPSTIKKGLQNPISKNQIIGITVIVMDFSAIFTTRDWDVSGFISTVAGAAPAALDS